MIGATSGRESGGNTQDSLPPHSQISSPWSKPYRKQPARVFWSTEQSLKGGGWIWEVEGKREKPVHLPRSHRPCLRRYRSNEQISKEQVIQLGKKKRLSSHLGWFE